MNIGCIFDSAAPITIGDDVHLGPGVALLTSAHTVGPATRRAGVSRPQAIVVHDGVWMGAHATVPQPLLRRQARASSRAEECLRRKPVSQLVGVLTKTLESRQYFHRVLRRKAPALHVTSSRVGVRVVKTL